jgi:hypothetical protein
MRRTVSKGVVAVTLALAILFSAIPARAGEASGGDEAAIRAVIESQLASFRRDDAQAAFSFASPSIQRVFRTPEIFMAMVRKDYQPVYRPRSVEFRALADVEGVLLQQVLLSTQAGRPVLALYEMQRQPDGRWKINGVRLVMLAGEET